LRDLFTFEFCVALAKDNNRLLDSTVSINTPGFIL
jgi:hypothetical protein